MIEIIPTILSETLADYRARIHIASTIADVLHIDITDGVFCDNKTLDLKVVLKNLPPKNLEAHLMVCHPSEYLDDLLKAKFKRIYLPFEMRESLAPLIAKIKKAGTMIGLSLNPETDVRRIQHYLDDLNTVLLLGVNPGFGGQEFIENTIPKLKWLSEMMPPGLEIEVDGGINSENANDIVQSGADILAIGSALIDSANPEVALEKIMRSIG